VVEAGACPLLDRLDVPIHINPAGNDLGDVFALLGQSRKGREIRAILRSFYWIVAGLRLAAFERS